MRWVLDKNNEYPLFKKDRIYKAYSKFQKQVLLVFSKNCSKKWKGWFDKFNAERGFQTKFTFKKIINPDNESELQQFLAFLSHIGFLKVINRHLAHNERTFELPVLFIDAERRIDVEWDKDFKTSRPAKITVVCNDSKGLLVAMSSVIASKEANISSADIRTIPDKKAICTFEVQVNDLDHLKSVIKSLQKVKNVIEVEMMMS